jgi:putative ABC transport system permease protein
MSDMNSTKSWLSTLDSSTRGLFILAFKLLVNDRSKFYALLMGITFAVFLMVQMTSMFAGVLKRASATILNVGAPIWVMDPAVNIVSSPIAMPDYVVEYVRSIKGVRFAVPLYSGGGTAHLPSGDYQPVTVIGLDDTSLYGAPLLTQGRIDNVYAENGFVVVADSEYAKLGYPTIGTEFELDDRRAQIVGVAGVNSAGLFGVPTLYTTYSRAIQYIPSTRFTTSFVLVEPQSAENTQDIQKEVKALGYEALTDEEFMSRTSDYYKYKTGMGVNILLMTIISFIVGLSLSGQTFYSFIQENLDKFGALKAIGAKSHELVLMILFQAFFVAFLGYGLGVGLCTLVIGFARTNMPTYAAIITPFNLLLAFVMVLIIAALSSYFGVRRVLKIEPFDIFRG